ncbi:mitogen-activated protein kinase 9-like [Hibiscus syriacus]|uniref:Mitogen-activated protein kinase 9-like n=1 Tax=Hibiscus syriacus TaxID=106335 RepID=A0A6A2WZ82_HIBSY|nr:mitogen-activated protein kinase 9-like [Hibiscus syriacus]
MRLAPQSSRTLCASMRLEPLITLVEDMLVGCLWQNDHIITVSLAGTINLYAASDLDRQPLCLSGHMKNVNTLTLLQSDEKKILSSSFDGYIFRWIPGTGFQQLRVINGLAQVLWDLSQAIDNPKLALVSTDSGVLLLKDLQVLASINVGFAGTASVIAPDGSEAIVGGGGQDGKLHIYSVSCDSLKEEATLEKHRGPISVLRYSPDFSMFASADLNREAVVWDRTSKEGLLDYKGSIFPTIGIGVNGLVKDKFQGGALKGKPASLSEGKEPDKPSDSSGDKGKSKMSEEEWEELDMRAASQIRLCLAKNVLANVARWSSTKELWEKLEEMYQAKSLSNRLYLKEKFHKLQMEEGTKISDHLSALNGIVSELESIGVEIDDEDKALRLIWSLPSSYEHMQTVLMYEKENVNFSEVTSKLISEERRLKNGENKSSESGALSVCGNRKKYKGSKKKIICWGCGQPGNLKKDCKNGGANSANGSKSDATNVKLNNMLFHSARINCLAWSPNSTMVATGSLDTNVIIYEIAKPASNRIIVKHAHPGGVYGLVFIDDCTVASSGEDACIRVWKIVQ